MNDEIKTRILTLRVRKSFSFSKEMTEKLISDYSMYRSKTYLSELKKVVCSSLNDGDLKVFEGAPGTGKSKVIHIYALLGLMQNRNVILSCNNFNSSLKMAMFIRKLAKSFNVSYKGKLKCLKYKELKDMEKLENAVILIDEAGFLPLDVADFLLQYAIDNKSVLALIGDLYQIALKPPKNGFLQIIKVLQQKNFKTHELKEIFRQRNQYDVKAIHNLRKHRIKEALMHYYKRKDYKSLRFFENKKDIIEKLVEDIKKSKFKDSIVIASNYRLQKFIKSELENMRINKDVLLPKEVQGMAFSQSFFVMSQKNIEIDELLVAFSRHKYRMLSYIDSSFGQYDIDKLVISVKVDII